MAEPALAAWDGRVPRTGMGTAGSHRRFPPAAGLPLALLWTLALAPVARAGSITAESVMDENNARQRALQQVPRDATVTRTRCSDFTVGLDNFRYRCTVWYEPAAPGEPDQQPPATPP